MSLTGQVGPVLDEISYKLKLLDHLQTDLCFPVALINHQYLIKQLTHIAIDFYYTSVCSPGTIHSQVPRNIVFSFVPAPWLSV